MKKITILFFIFIYTSSISQSKSTAVLSFNADMTAKFTLDKETSKLTLVLTAPADKWTSLGLGTSSSTTGGDVYVYTTSVIENTNVSTNSNQDWSTVSNTVSSGVRTVTLERALTTSDLNDLQMAFDTTNAIDVVWSRSGSAIATAPNPNRGSTKAVFSANLGVEDVSFYDEVMIYPNPTSSELFIKTKKGLTKINIYSQTGVLVKTISSNGNSNELKIDVSNLAKSTYIFELQSDSEKTWKKVIVN
jgi:hypothetical protein